jgi:hypothetical protein
MENNWQAMFFDGDWNPIGAGCAAADDTNATSAAMIGKNVWDNGKRDMARTGIR